MGASAGGESSNLRSLSCVELVSLAKRMDLPGRDKARLIGKEALINLLQQHAPMSIHPVEVRRFARRLGITNSEGKNVHLVLDEMKQYLKRNPTLVSTLSRQELMSFLKLNDIPFAATESRESLLPLLENFLTNTAVNFRKRKLLATYSSAAKKVRGGSTPYHAVFGGGSRYRREYQVDIPQAPTPSYADAAASLKTPLHHIMRESMEEFKAMTVQLAVQVNQAYIQYIVYKSSSHTSIVARVGRCRAAVSDPLVV